MGRPAIEITTEICDKAESLAAQGLTLEQIATVLGMSYQTLNEKRKEFSEFSEALDRGKAKGIAVQINALFERGRGYSHPEEKIFCNKDGEITKVQTTKHYPPETAAGLAWLSNKDPDNWSIKRDVKHSGTIAHKHDGLPGTIEFLEGFRQQSKGEDGQIKGSLPN